MPRQYEAIRDRLIEQGYSEDEAKRIAAATYNRDHPNDPVGRYSDEKGDNKTVVRLPKENE